MGTPASNLEKSTSPEDAQSRLNRLIEADTFAAAQEIAKIGHDHPDLALPALDRMGCSNILPSLVTDVALADIEKNGVTLNTAFALNLLSKSFKTAATNIKPDITTKTAQLITTIIKTELPPILPGSQDKIPAKEISSAFDAIDETGMFPQSQLKGQWDFITENREEIGRRLNNTMAIKADIEASLPRLP